MASSSQSIASIKTLIVRRLKEHTSPLFRASSRSLMDRRTNDRFWDGGSQACVVAHGRRSPASSGLLGGTALPARYSEFHDAGLSIATPTSSVIELLQNNGHGSCQRCPIQDALVFR